jgi:hypothetical protein
MDYIGMNLEGINAGNWVDSAQVREIGESFECGIQPPGSISHGVS